MILDYAQRLRLEPRRGALMGRALVMFFEKTSTRTRLSFEIGMAQLGGHAVQFDPASSQLSRGESLRDTALVVSRYADVLMARVVSHETLTEMARYASIPVINGLSDLEHPCQSLSDLLTIRDHKGNLSGLKVAYVGDGNNNVTHSLLLACSLMGIDISVASPASLSPRAEYIDLARTNADQSRSKISVTTEPREAVEGADVVYTDVWVSMGQELEAANRLSELVPYQVNEHLLEVAKPDHIFMHCLPQHIGHEVTAEVAYGPHSVVFDQAESRLHAQKALILFLLGLLSN